MGVVGIFVVIGIVILIRIMSNSRLRLSLQYGIPLGGMIGVLIGKLINWLFTIGEKGFMYCISGGAIVGVIFFWLILEE